MFEESFDIFQSLGKAHELNLLVSNCQSLVAIDSEVEIPDSESKLLIDGQVLTLINIARHLIIATESASIMCSRDGKLRDYSVIRHFFHPFGKGSFDRKVILDKLS